MLSESYRAHVRSGKRLRRSERPRCTHLNKRQRSFSAGQDFVVWLGTRTVLQPSKVQCSSHWDCEMGTAMNSPDNGHKLCRRSPICKANVFHAVILVNAFGPRANTFAKCKFRIKSLSNKLYVQKHNASTKIPSGGRHGYSPDSEDMNASKDLHVLKWIASDVRWRFDDSY